MTDKCQKWNIIKPIVVGTLTYYFLMIYIFGHILAPPPPKYDRIFSKTWVFKKICEILLEFPMWEIMSEGKGKTYLSSKMEIFAFETLSMYSGYQKSCLHMRQCNKSNGTQCLWLLVDTIPFSPLSHVTPYP